MCTLRQCAHICVCDCCCCIQHCKHTSKCGQSVVEYRKTSQWAKRKEAKRRCFTVHNSFDLVIFIIWCLKLHSTVCGWSFFLVLIHFSLSLCSLCVCTHFVAVYYFIVVLLIVTFVLILSSFERSTYIHRLSQSLSTGHMPKRIVSIDYVWWTDSIH